MWEKYKNLNWENESFLKSKNGFVIDTPNFETARFWPQNLSYLGPYWVTNTVLLENKHLHLRNLQRITNLKDIEKQTMILDQIITDRMLASNTNEPLACTKDSYYLYAPKACKTKVPHYGTANWTFKGINFRGCRVKPGSFFYASTTGNVSLFYYATDLLNC